MPDSQGDLQLPRHPNSRSCERMARWVELRGHIVTSEPGFSPLVQRATIASSMLHSAGKAGSASLIGRIWTVKLPGNSRRMFQVCGRQVNSHRGNSCLNVPVVTGASCNPRGEIRAGCRSSPGTSTLCNELAISMRSVRERAACSNRECADPRAWKPATRRTPCALLRASAPRGSSSRHRATGCRRVRVRRTLRLP